MRMQADGHSIARRRRRRFWRRLAGLPAAALGLALLAAPAASTPAKAFVIYPWCGYHYGIQGGSECGYVSFEACRQMMTGLGFCARNPASYAVEPTPPPRRRKAR